MRLAVAVLVQKLPLQRCRRTVRCWLLVSRCSQVLQRVVASFAVCKKIKETDTPLQDTHVHSTLYIALNKNVVG